MSGADERERALASFIETFTNGEREIDFARDLDRWRGWGPNVWLLREWLPEGFIEVEEWSNGFRTVWADGERGLLITYCEGDVSVEAPWHAPAWRDLLGYCKRFYLEHA